MNLVSTRAIRRTAEVYLGRGTIEFSPILSSLQGPSRGHYCCNLLRAEETRVPTLSGLVHERVGHSSLRFSYLLNLDLD